MSWLRRGGGRTAGRDREENRGGGGGFCLLFSYRGFLRGDAGENAVGSGGREPEDIWAVSFQRDDGSLPAISTETRDAVCGRNEWGRWPRLRRSFGSRKTAVFYGCKNRNVSIWDSESWFLIRF